MKKTEADKRWELLQNPVKRKKLQAAWEHALIRDLKKSKKKKKKKRSSSNHSVSSTSRKRSKKTSKSRDIVKAAESDDKIRNSLKMALESQLGELSSDDSSDSSSDEDRRIKSKKASKRKTLKIGKLIFIIKNAVFFGHRFFLELKFCFF